MIKKKKANKLNFIILQQKLYQENRNDNNDKFCVITKNQLLVNICTKLKL